MELDNTQIYSVRSIIKNTLIHPWGNIRYQTTTERYFRAKISKKNRFFSFCTKSIQIAFIDFKMVPGGLLGLRESRRAPRCIILWFWALLKNRVFGTKTLTLPNGLKICFSKAERNQFSDFNMNYHVKPRQFQAHMDQFWRSVGQIFDLRSRNQNRKTFFFQIDRHFFRFELKIGIFWGPKFRKKKFSEFSNIWSIWYPMTPKRSQTMLWVSKGHSEASEALYIVILDTFLKIDFWGSKSTFWVFLTIWM